MIFRRSNDITPSKNVMSNTSQRPSNTPQSRSEPEMTARSSYNAPSAPTAPQTASQPLSPIAMAQARRTNTGATPSSSFNRQEQLRKLTVGRDISLNGEITTCDHLIVEGNVQATIKGGQILEIMETGTFHGVVDIEQADIAGKFEGDLVVRGKLVIRPTAIVTGSIRYGRLQVDAGAVLDGQIASLTPAETATAPQDTTPTYTPATTSTANDQPGFLKASA